MYGYRRAFIAKGVVRQGVLVVLKKRNTVVAIVKNNCIFAPALGAPTFNGYLKVEN